MLHFITVLSVVYRIDELEELLCPVKSGAPDRKRAKALAAITRTKGQKCFSHGHDSR